MELDDELCLCFHVTRRKAQNFLRVNKLVRASQMSECFGAGTGCGWCRPYLQRLFAAYVAEADAEPDLPASAEYSQGRTRYVRRGGGTPPPGATPIAE
jgi:bacterioferritin-associated ferredoxin